MNERTAREVLDSPLTNRMLKGLKTRALRKRVWYEVLSRMERGLLDLTMLWVDEVKNRTMRRVVIRILLKLARAMEKSMGRVLGVGRELALRASVLAVKWENARAYAWRSDESFWRGLALGLGRARIELGPCG